MTLKIICLDCHREIPSRTTPAHPVTLEVPGLCDDFRNARDEEMREAAEVNEKKL